MSLVPALQEMHEAHKARQARMAGRITAPPKPLPFAIPPERTVVVPQPIELPSLRKHQITTLHAAGWSQGRIAKRLMLTPGQVSGVLHRARAEEHKLLLCDVCLILFDLCFDTYEIGGLVDEPECVVHKLIAWGKERRRREAGL